ncbi:hypothetical protein PR048_010260 [Dryococelus australis]|uniref:Uncharacterized protein n=1 Tax=Dryococelus australis TaxID=614101 RepID=A0ABQ9I325_9NEOP|nr:hypothetical protein PR048_010260 [Dryococelus australis]
MHGNAFNHATLHLRREMHRLAADGGKCCELELLPPIHHRRKFWSKISHRHMRRYLCSTSHDPLDLGLNCSYIWLFVQADVQAPVVGADFLKHFNLLPAVSNGQLLDANISLTTTCSIAVDSAINKLYTVPPGHSYTDLKEFPGILQQNPSFIIPSCNVTHAIKTTGPPVHSRAWQLPPYKLAAAKIEFQQMMDMVSAKGVLPIPDSVATITGYPLPKTVTELPRFLGMINFYRRCLPYSAATQAALLKFIPGSQKITVTSCIGIPKGYMPLKTSKVACPMLHSSHTPQLMLPSTNG